MSKKYSAFISSVSALKEERAEAINLLLDFGHIPVAMEYFTVAAGSGSNSFDVIQNLINAADIFILLLGDEYGSCDSDGVSWTEREYKFAVSTGKPILAITCPSFKALEAKPESQQTEAQRKQMNFKKSIPFGIKPANSTQELRRLITQFLSSSELEKCAGWIRGVSAADAQADLEKWRNENQLFHLAGTWYHVHLNKQTSSYIRIGEVEIEQDFSPENYRNIKLSGHNHGAAYFNRETNTLVEDDIEYSSFTGEYTIHTNKTICGIYTSDRSFDGTFDSLEVKSAVRRGVHDLRIISNERIQGAFRDLTPSPKSGLLFLFRDIGQRNAFLLEHRGHIIQQK